MVQLVVRACILLLLGLLAACARGPDAEDVHDAMQRQLDEALDGRVLTVESLKTAGGAPLASPPGRIVYFNARLALVKPYDFGQWNAHSVASLSNLLGAGPKGIVGLKQGGNQAGDTLGVYGSASFALRDGRYVLVPAVPVASGDAEVPPAASASVVRQQPREEPPPTPLGTARERLRELERQGGKGLEPAERDAILTDEYDQAYARARARMDRALKVTVVAGGPRGGAYAATMEALLARAEAANLPLDVVVTEGSLGNVRLLSERSAQFALAQNDVVRSAYQGRGRFSGAPQPALRAVASLFPEAIHLVARAGSGIQGVADLKGKRVDIGPDGSGTRANALSILALSGIPEAALGGVSGLPLAEAAEALASGKVDALFATIHAPAAELARLAARTKVTLVPLGPSRELVDAGLVPLTLPPLTYAGQSAPVPTLAATAMIVTREDVAAPMVSGLMKLLFDARGGPQSAAVSQIDVRQARAGVTIPFHPEAEAFFRSRADSKPPAR
jgi:TRAP transporter TAXI family solute receptor